MRGMIVIMLMALSVVAGQAQETRELTRQEKKEMQARLDSLLHVEAEEAVNARAFTLEADKVMFKYGETAYVTSTTNFVSVKGDDAVVQVAFNVPVSGPNGLGGVTVDGSVSSYEVEKDKRGNLLLTMNVLGTGISARVDITLYKGSNEASVTITPNFNSNRMTLSGQIVPIEKSKVFKGRSI